MSIFDAMGSGGDLAARLDKLTELLSRMAHAQESLAETERARLIAGQGRTAAARLIVETRQHDHWIAEAERAKKERRW